MQVVLTPELEKLIDDQVASGTYRTAGEVIRAALRLLKEMNQRKLEARDPHPYVVGADSVDRYLTVAHECALAALATVQ